jgi:hypothetical protein
MGSRKLFYGILITVVCLVVYIFIDSFSQPGIGDLKGEYKEVSFFRNENNTGPIIRIYAVYTPDSLWEEMEQYGNYMPHSKYGNTKVFFFGKQKDTPQKLYLEPPHFDQELAKNCIAFYEKSAMGQVSFVKFPFK